MYGKLCTKCSKFESIVGVMNFQLNPKCRYSRGVREGGWSKGRSTPVAETAGSGPPWAGEGASLPPSPGPVYVDFSITSLIRSAAVAEALCNVAVDRCE